MVADPPLVLAVGEVIEPLRVAVVVLVVGPRRGVDRGERRRGVIANAAGEVRIEERPRVGGGRAVVDAGADDVARRVLVRFGLGRVGGVERQLAGSVVVDELGVCLPAALVAVEIPRAGVEVLAREIEAVAVAELAGVEADELAEGAVAARRRRCLDAGALLRVAGEGVDRAAEVRGRRRAEVAGAARQRHPRDVFADDGALRRQAVVVAVLLVAQGHAIERVAELLRVEAVDVERDVLLVVAERVGGQIGHAGQGLQRLQRADAGQHRLDLRPLDFRHGADPVRGDDDLAAGVAGCGRVGVGRAGLAGERQRGRGQQNRRHRAAHRHVPHVAPRR